MTKQELKKYFWLTHEVEMQKKRLKTLERREELSNDTVGDTVKDYRTGKGIPVLITGIPEEGFTLPLLIKTLKVAIEKNIHESERARIAIEEYIQAIPNPMTREIMRGRFIDCLKWEEIGKRNYIAGDYARHIAMEYIKENL